MTDEKYLIDDKEEFCQGYFHVDKSFEWDQSEFCICRKVCMKNTVRGVVHVTDELGDTIFLRKYQNEFRGHTEENLHVEDIMIADETLSEVLEDDPRGKKIVTLYISYQPCHHSGGYVKLKGLHKKSCTEVLMKWFSKLPNTVKVVIKCCGIYRAHWEDDAYYKTEYDNTLKKRTNSSREGLIELLKFDQERFFVEAMNPRSWDDFLQFCDPEITISKQQWKIRDNFDEKVDKFLKKLREK